MATWYVRDNSTVNTTDSLSLTIGSVGWSGMTAWAASTVIAAGALRRATGGTASFTASQTTTTLTVTGSPTGTIYLGMRLSPPSGTVVTVTALGTGTGGAGTYTVSLSQSVASGAWTGAMQAGINERAWVATVGGTTAATQPNWSFSTNNTKGAKVTDNTVTWVECSGQPAVNGDLTNTPLSSSVRSTAQTVGKIITDNAGTHIFICTTAGTPGSGEPTYTTTAVGNTTTDGSATWTYIGTSFSSWAAPHARVANNVFGTNWAAAGDTIYVGDDHAEITQPTSSTTISPTGTNASPNFLYSIDHTLSLPVSSGGLKTGASIAVQGASTILAIQSATSSAYWYGITFSAGNGSNSGTIQPGPSSGSVWIKFDSCNLKLNTTSASGLINFLGSGADYIELYNTTMQFGSSGQSCRLAASTDIVWRNTASAILGTAPTTLFTGTGSSFGNMTLEGVDLSAVTGTISPAGTAGSTAYALYLIDCKLGSGVTIASTPVSIAGPATDVIRCSSTSTTYVQRRYWYEGTLQEETTVIRTNGASDGTTGISWNLTTTANSRWVEPFESFPIAIWNGTTATNRVITLHGIWNAAALPNNDDVWIDVAYLGDSLSPQASFATETKSNNIASSTPLTADSSSAWDSVASARQNSHAYSLGNIIKTSSNAGRIFFCTSAGTTAGTEPAGYAGAVDGGSVTDSGAVFRAATRFLLTVTLSTPQPQLVGYVRAYVKAAKASSTFYIDPLIVLS